MAANTIINYKMNLTANTASAQRSLKEVTELFQDLESISRDVKLFPESSKELQKSMSDIKALQKALKEGFSYNSKNLDLSKFSASLAKSNTSINTVISSLNTMGATGQSAIRNLTQAFSQAQVPIRQTNKMIDSLFVNLQKTMQWQISSSLIHGFIGEIQSAIGYVRNLNNALNEIQIVSDLDAGGIADFAKRAQAAAKELKASTLDYVDAATIYFQQGDDMASAMQKAAITIKAANASAKSSAEEMSEYMTAIWNSYQVGANELERYADVMAALGAKTATSMEEIATSMQKVAATGNAVGVSFSQMSSIIATVSSVTRESAESVGTAYKTILARIGDLKLGGTDEDGIGLGLVSSQLKEMGVNILDAKGQLRDMGGVIEEIGSKWQFMSKNQQVALAQAVAGKRQYTQLIALFDNFQSYQNNMDIAGASTGALNKMQDTWAQSWEAASKRVQNATQGIYSNLLDDKFFVSVTNGFADILNSVQSVIQGMGGMKSIISMIGGMFLSKLGSRVTETFENIKKNIKIITGLEVNDMVKSMQKLEVASKNIAKYNTEMAGKSAGDTAVRYRQKAEMAQMNAQEMQYKQRLTSLSNGAYVTQPQRESMETSYNEYLQAMEQYRQVSAQAAETEIDTIQKTNQALAEQETAYDKIAQQQQQQQDAQKALADFNKIHYLREAKKEAKRQGYSDEEAQNRAATQMTKHLEELQKESAALDEVIAKRKQYKEVLQNETNAGRQAAVQNSFGEFFDSKGQGIGPAAVATELEQLSAEMVKFDFTRTDEEAKAKAKEFADRYFRIMGEAFDTTSQMTDVQTRVGEAFGNIMTDGVATVNSQEVVEDIKVQMQNLISSLPAEMEPYSQYLNNIFQEAIKIETEQMELVKKGELKTEDAAKAIQDAYKTAIEKAFDGLDPSIFSKELEELFNAQGGLLNFDPKKIKEMIEQYKKQAKDRSNKRDGKNHANKAEEDMKDALNPKVTVLDQMTKVTGGLMQMASAAQMVVGSWKTLNNENATFLEKLTAGITMLTGLTTTFQAIRAILLGITGAQNVAEAIRAGLVNEIETSEKSITKEKGKQILETGTETLLSKKGLKGFGKSLGKGALKLAPYIIAAASLTAGVVSLVKAFQYAGNVANEQQSAIESLSAATEKASSFMDKSRADQINLASAIKNTTNSYKEQLDVINEIVSEYGVLATAQDVVTGNYSLLQSRVEDQTVAQLNNDADALMASHDATVKKTDARIDVERGADVDNGSWMGAGAGIAGGAGAIAGGLIGGAKLGGAFGTAISPGLGTLIGGFIGAIIGVVAGGLLGLGVGAGAAAITENINAKNGIKSDFFNNYQSSNEEYQSDTSSDERREWIRFLSENEDLGISIKNGKFDTSELAHYDAAQLEEVYRTITGDADLMAYAGSGGFMSDYLKEMSRLQVDVLANSAEQAEQNRRIATMYTQTDFDQYATEIQGFEDIMNIFDQMQTAGQSLDFDAIQGLLSYMSGFEGYQEAAMQMSALGNIATESASRNDEADKDEVQDAVFEHLMEMVANGELTLDEAIYLSASDVQVNVTEDGIEVEVSPEAIEYAQKKAEKQMKLTVRSSIDVIYDVATKDTISYEDYQTLQQSDYFKDKTPEELRAFASLSAEERASYLNRQKRFTADDLVTQKELVDASAADFAAKEATFNQGKLDWYSQLDVMGNFSDIFGDSVEMADVFAMSIEEQADLAFRHMSEKKKANDAIIEKYQQQSRLESEYFGTTTGAEVWDMTWEDINTGDKSQENLAILKKYGITSEAEWQAAVDLHREGIGEYEDYNGRYAQGMQEVLNLQDDFVAAQAEAALQEENYEALEYWIEYGQALSDAKTAAEGFASAVGQSGKMSAEQLKTLAEFDPNVLTKYATMTSDEWDAYAIAQTQKYYDELSAFYEGDLAKQLEISQQKEAAIESYYDGLREKAEDAYEAVNKQYEENLGNIENALSLLDSIGEDGLSEMGFDSLEELRQALMEVYHDAEAVDRIIKNIGKTEAGSIDEVIALADAEMMLRMKGHEEHTKQKELLDGVATVAMSASAEGDIAPPFKTTEDGAAITAETEGAEVPVSSQVDPNDIYLCNTSATLKPLGNAPQGTYTILADDTGAQKKAMHVNPSTGEVTLYDLGEETAAYVVSDDATGMTLVQANGSTVYLPTSDALTAGAQYIVTDDHGGLQCVKVDEDGITMQPITGQSPVGTYVVQDSGTGDILWLSVTKDGVTQKTLKPVSKENVTGTYGIETSATGDGLDYLKVTQSDGTVSVIPLTQTLGQIGTYTIKGSPDGEYLALIDPENGKLISIAGPDEAPPAYTISATSGDGTTMVDGEIRANVNTDPLYQKIIVTYEQGAQASKDLAQAATTVINKGGQARIVGTNAMTTSYNDDNDNNGELVTKSMGAVAAYLDHGYNTHDGDFLAAINTNKGNDLHGAAYAQLNSEVIASLEQDYALIGRGLVDFDQSDAPEEGWDEYDYSALFTTRGTSSDGVTRSGLEYLEGIEQIGQILWQMEQDGELDDYLIRDEYGNYDYDMDRLIADGRISGDLAWVNSWSAGENQDAFERAVQITGGYNLDSPFHLQNWSAAMAYAGTPDSVYNRVLTGNGVYFENDYHEQGYHNLVTGEWDYDNLYAHLIADRQRTAQETGNIDGVGMLVDMFSVAVQRNLDNNLTEDQRVANMEGLLSTSNLMEYYNPRTGSKYTTSDVGALTMLSWVESLSPEEMLQQMPALSDAFSGFFKIIEKSQDPLKEFQNNMPLISKAMGEYLAPLKDQDEELWKQESAKLGEEYGAQILNAIGMTKEALQEGLLENGLDTEGEKAAQYLVQGLIDTLGAESPAVAAVAAALGFETIEAMRAALQIHSPSKATMEMGYYLVKGLEEGINGTQIEITGFTENLLASIKNAIGEVDIEKLWNEQTEGLSLGITRDTLSTLPPEVQQAVLAQLNKESGTNVEDTNKDGSITLSDITDAQVSAIAADPEKYGITVPQMTHKEWLAQKGYVVKKDATTGYYQIGSGTTYDEQGNGILAEGTEWTEGFYRTEEDALNAARAMEYATEVAADYFDGGFLVDSRFKPAEQGLMSQMIKETLTDLGTAAGETFASVEEYLSSGGTLDEWYAALDKTYVKYQENFTNAVDLSWAEMKQSWFNTLATCQDMEDSFAEQTYERWKTVWEGVAALRLAALNGEEGMVGDLMGKEARDEYIRRMVNQNTSSNIGSFSDIASTLFGGVDDLDKTTTTLLTLPSYTQAGYGSRMSQMGLTPNAYGFATAPASLDAYQTRYTTDFQSDVQYLMDHTDNFTDAAHLGWAVENDVPVNGVYMTDEEYATKYLEAYGLEDTADNRALALAERSVARILHESGNLVKDDEKGWQYTDGTEETMSSGDALAFTKMILEKRGLMDGDAYINPNKWMSMMNEGLAAAYSAQADYLVDYYTQFTDEMDTKINRNQQDQQLLSKYKNGEALTSTEQSRVDKLLNTYGSVEAASMALAADMDQCAGASVRLAEAMALGLVPVIDGLVTEAENVKTKNRTLIGDEDTRYATEGEAIQAAIVAGLLSEDTQLGQFTLNEEGTEYSMTTVEKDAYGRYYLRTDVVPADQVIDVSDEDATYTYTDSQGNTQTHNFSDNGHYYQDQEYAERASDAGFSGLGELDEQANYLARLNGEIKEGTELSGEMLDRYRDISIMAKKAAKGWDGLTSSGKDYVKTMRDSTKSSDDYMKAARGLKKDLKNIFGDSEQITEEFVAAHLDDIEKMADGDVEAAERIEKALLEDMLGDNDLQVNIDVNEDGVVNQLDNLSTLLNGFGDQYADEEIGFTITADDEPAINALNALLQSGAMTADQMNQLLATIGWKPEITYQTADGKSSYSGEQIQTMIGDGTATQVKGTSHFEIGGQIYFPVIGSVQKTGGGASSIPTGKKNGGGGGGGGKPTATKKKDKDKERYHEVTKLLDKQANILDRIGKEKERAYGKSYVDQLNKETAALKQNIEYQKRYLKEIEKNKSKDKREANKLLGQFGLSLQDPDGDGVVDNWEEIQDAMWDAYNSHINDDGEVIDMDEDEWADYEEAWQDAMDALNQYEETMALSQEQQNELEEMMNNLSDLNAEKITYVVETKLELNDADIELLEYFQDKYEDGLEDQDQYFSALMANAQKEMDSIRDIRQAMTDLDAAYRMTEGLTGEALHAAIEAGGITLATWQEEMTNLNSDLIDKLSTLQDLKEQMAEMYGQTLELALDRLEEQIGYLDSVAEAMASFRDLSMRLGDGATSGALRNLEAFFEIEKQANEAAMQGRIDYYKTVQSELAEWLEQNGTNPDNWTDTQKQQYADLMESVTDAHSAMIDAITAQLDTLQEEFENSIDTMAKTFEERVSAINSNGESMFTSFAQFQEAYSYFQEQQDQYLSTAQEMLNINKLNRNIEQSMEDAVTKTGKARLEALQKEIKARSEAGKLSQYDLDMMNLQYELVLKKNALEEAQNAKDTVRLTRDEHGNMAYQYTANEDNVAKAEQEYEDVLAQINDLSTNRQSELLSQFADAEAQYAQQLAEIAKDTSLSYEERQARMEQLAAQYKDRLLYLQEQYSQATSDLTNNEAAIGSIFGTSVNDANAFADAVDAMFSEEAIQSHIEAAENMANGMISAMGDYETQLTNLNNQLDGLIPTEEEMAQWSDFISGVGDQIEGVNDDLATELDQLQDINEEWLKMEETINRLVPEYEALAQAVNDMVRDAAELEESGAVNVDMDTTVLSQNIQDQTDLQRTHYEYVERVLEMIANDEDTQRALVGTPAAVTDEVADQVFQPHPNALNMEDHFLQSIANNVEFIARILSDKYGYAELEVMAYQEDLMEQQQLMQAEYMEAIHDVMYDPSLGEDERIKRVQELGDRYGEYLAVAQGAFDMSAAVQNDMFEVFAPINTLPTMQTMANQWLSEISSQVGYMLTDMGSLAAMIKPMTELRDQKFEQAITIAEANFPGVVDFQALVEAIAELGLASAQTADSRGGGGGSRR